MDSEPDLTWLVVVMTAVGLVGLLAVAFAVVPQLLRWRPRWPRLRWRGLRRRRRGERPATEPAVDEPSPADAEADADVARRALDSALVALREPADPRGAVIEAYARMEEVLASRELGRRTPEAPREYLGRVLREQGMPERSLTTLTELFEEARFSPHPIPASTSDQARRELRAAARSAAALPDPIGLAGSRFPPKLPRESGSTYAHVAGLPLVIERCELRPLVRDTSGGFTKVSIVVRLTGGSHAGEGEDITWDQIDQIELLRGGADLAWLHGTRTFDEFSRLLGLANLFPVAPIRDSARQYRRWAFESAALDLALRQNGLSLQDAVGRPAEPVAFVASVRIGDPPSLLPLQARLGVDPRLRFKLDPTAGWDDDLVGELARLGCVDVIDLKGRYRNATVAMDAEPACTAA